MESKYFDSRIDFLKHCQDNQYQFDTLRRAKHSTMMILYNLHDSACSACHRAMDQRFAWRCLVCAGCKFCDSCYKQDGENLHIHKLKQADNQQLLPNYTLQVSVLSLSFVLDCSVLDLFCSVVEKQLQNYDKVYFNKQSNIQILVKQTGLSQSTAMPKGC